MSSFDATAFAAALPTWDPTTAVAPPSTISVVIIGDEGTGKSSIATTLANVHLGVSAVYAPVADATPTSSVGAAPTLQYVLQNQEAMGASASTVAYVHETVLGGHTAADNAALATAIGSGAAVTKVRVVATSQSPIDLPARETRGAAVTVLLLPMVNQLFCRDAYKKWISPSSGIPNADALQAVLNALPQYTALVLDFVGGTVSQYTVPAPTE